MSSFNMQEVVSTSNEKGDDNSNIPNNRSHNKFALNESQDMGKCQLQNFQDIAEFQEQLIDMNETNFEELFNEILQSRLIKSKMTFRSILISIYIAFISRPHKEQLYMNLFIRISKLPENHFKPIDYLINFSNPFFILNLYNAGIIPLDAIHEQATRCPDLITYFFPELYTSFFHSSIVRSHHKNTPFDHSKKIVQQIRLVQIESFIDINAAETFLDKRLDWLFRTFTEYRSSGHNPCILTQAIFNDNVQEMQDILAKNNIPPNALIPSSIFETSRMPKSHGLPSLIEYAAYFGSIQCFKFLFQKCELLHFPTLVNYAVCGGNYEIIHLCESVLSDNFTQETLACSIQFFQREVSEYLLDNFPIKRSIFSACVSIIFYNLGSLIDHKDELDADPNGTDAQGSTPLSLASLNGDLDVVTFMLSTFKNIDINNPNTDGNVPLIQAAKKGHFELIQYLTSFPQIDINYQNLGGICALHVAALRGHFNIVKFLCSLPNIELNSESKTGVNSVSFAAYYGHFDIVKYFISLPNFKLHTTLELHDVVYFAAISEYNAIFEYIIDLCEQQKIETVQLIRQKAEADYPQIKLPADILNNTIEPSTVVIKLEDRNEEEEEDELYKAQIAEHKSIRDICSTIPDQYHLWQYYKYHYPRILQKVCGYARHRGADEIIKFLKKKHLFYKA